MSLPPRSTRARKRRSSNSSKRHRRDGARSIISHRFSTVRRANKICVLEGGIVAELGTHEELMESGKTYAQLFKLQAKGYE